MATMCRICLRTDKTLQELSDSLMDHFQEICEYNTGFLKHLCCSQCEVDLKSSLDFKGRCLHANKIFQEWKKDKSKNKTPIKSLHELLQTSSINDEKCIEMTKPENTIDSDETSNDCIIEDINTNSDLNNSNTDEINIETVKEEVETDNVFETIDETNHYDACTDDDDDGGIHNPNDDKTDNDVSIIECASETEAAKSNKPKTEEAPLKQSSKMSDHKTNKRQINRVYTRKGPSAYSKYEEVFDIQLFSTDEEARSEMLQRRVSEPYLSASHRCELCYTVYKCDKLLRYHMKCHDTSSGEFVCDICSMRYPELKSMRGHKSHNHRGKFTCKLCPVITYYGSTMKAHFQMHQGKTFKCDCGLTFVHISSYLSHKRTVHRSSHVCVTCARTFISELGLQTHRMRAHQTRDEVDNQTTARCEACDLTFVSQQVYNVHVLNTPDHAALAASMTACQYCGLSFSDATKLKAHKRHKHQRRSDTNDTLTCDLCGAQGVGRVWRWRHYASEHPNVSYLEEVSDARKYICERCGKRFVNISFLKDHMNLHLGLKPFQCVQCPLTFSSRSARSAHTERHAPPSHVCDNCGAAFRSRANLAVHMRSHNGVRSYVCACGKSFLHRASLREHELGVHQRIRRTRAKRQPDETGKNTLKS